MRPSRARALEGSAAPRLRGRGVASCAITFTRPTHNAILPDLADTPEEFTAANAASSMVEGLGTFVGPALNASSSSGSDRGGGRGDGLRDDRSQPGSRFICGCAETPTSRRSSIPRSFVDDASEGCGSSVRSPARPLLLVVGGSQFFLIGLLDVFYALLAIDVLAVGSSGAGALAAGYGSVAWSVRPLAVVLAGRRRLSAAMLGGLVASGATLAAVGFAGEPRRRSHAARRMRCSRSFFDVAARTLLQRAVREDVLARVFGLEEALQMGGLAVGSATAPFLVSRFGPQGAFVASGLSLAAVALGTWPRLRQVDAAGPRARSRARAALGHPVFAPLAQHVAERLSWDLVPVDVAAGTVVIREGDAGDRCSLVADGEVDVITRRPADRAARTRLLLRRDRPASRRPADGHGYGRDGLPALSLERDAFLTALTGSEAKPRDRPPGSGSTIERPAGSVASHDRNTPTCEV